MKLELNIDVNNTSTTSNAVLWYESNVPGEGREAGKVIPRQHFIPVRTIPDLPNDILFYTSPELIQYIENEKEKQCILSCTGTITNAVLYSNDGITIRNSIKKELENKINQRTTTICLLTCGLITCCCCAGCCCDKKDDINNVTNEEYYCNQIRIEYPTTGVVNDTEKYTFECHDVYNEDNDKIVDILKE